MDLRPTRRNVLQAGAAASAVLASAARAAALPRLGPSPDAAGWITGRLTGARAAVAALRQQGVGCVFGIPGAQENELWDALKSGGVPYLLAAHEFSAACMADGYARSTGCPGVIAVVPGPGVTNSLTGLGEALLDSVPIVALVGDVGIGDKAHAFQVHSLDQAALLKPVTKGVRCVCRVDDIPCAIQQAFALARSGEPGPVAVVIPYNLLIEAADFHVGPPEPPGLCWDEVAAERALALLANRKWRVGIYAGLGCMDAADRLVAVAEVLHAPVSTSVSGKGVFPETHPLGVGWGYGPQGTRTAELAFQDVDCLLAIGVRFSEVSTGYYSNPRPRHVVQVDANPDNIGRVLKADVGVPADAGLFLDYLLARADCLRRPPDARLRGFIQKWKCVDRDAAASDYGRCGVDPMRLVLALRRQLGDDALFFTDVALAEHLAAEAFTACRPRTYFNPVDNQAMGWSIPAALGAQAAHPGRCVVTLTGDGCLLMSAMELSTAARAGLPVKFFVLDNQVYKYMQQLQLPAYRQTTATILARLDYAALAQALGLRYVEIAGGALDEQVRSAVCAPGPVLVRVVTDYGERPIRWIEAVRKKFTRELSLQQKTRFAARLGARTLDFKPPMND
jgi:acetolactate synthase-1/2/3 large subunit